VSHKNFGEIARDVPPNWAKMCVFSGQEK